MANNDSRPTPDSDQCVPAVSCPALLCGTPRIPAFFLQVLLVRAAPVWPPSAQHRGQWRALCCASLGEPACRPPLRCLPQPPARWERNGACSVVRRRCSTVATSSWATTGHARPTPQLFVATAVCSLASLFLGHPHHPPPPHRCHRAPPHALTCLWATTALFYFLRDAPHRANRHRLPTLLGRGGRCGAATGRIGPPGRVGRFATRPPLEGA